MSEKYYVIRWDTYEVLKEFDNLGRAERYARRLGHTGVTHRLLTGFAPVAYVGDELKNVIYNPYFSNRIGSALGGMIIDNDDCLRG